MGTAVYGGKGFKERTWVSCEMPIFRQRSAQLSFHNPIPPLPLPATTLSPGEGVCLPVQAWDWCPVLVHTKSVWPPCHSLLCAGPGLQSQTGC